MFRLHKLKSQKSGERLNFKFFNFHALQVPKGWDKLYVSIVSTETGKTLTKSGKASVRNASCQWTETLSESIWISRHDSSKQIGDCFFKLVVSMGSARSSILGEATVNLASYKNSKTAVPVSLSLKKCNHGTILQVKIQCLTPRANLREEQSEETDSHMEDVNVDCDDVESKSDVSDNSLTKSIGSSSSSHLDSSSHAGELLNRDFSFSASGSRYSFDSTDGSLGRETYSPLNNLTGIMNNQIGRQDSTGSQNSSHGSYSFNDSSRSNQSSFNSKVLASRSSLQIQRDEFNQVSRSVASSPLRNAGSSKDLLEAAEAKIEELRAEARMWEQNARKLMNDLEKLRKELSDQSKCQASLEMELSESRRECDGLKQEIEQVKILLEESLVKQKSAENMELQAKDMGNLQKELEDEVRFEKESNANLALQLKKTQESNIELVSILQELEDTIEKLKMEIANLSKVESNDKNVGECTAVLEQKPNEEVLENNTSELSCVSVLESSTTVGDSPASFGPEDKRNTELEIREFQELQNNLECTIQFLEKSLQEKVQELEAAEVLKTQTLMECEAQWRDKLAVKEEEIINLKSKLSEALKVDNFENGADKNLIKEVEVLKQKIEELEKDCNELTDENLELLLKLKESEKDLPICGASSNHLSNEYEENSSLSISESEVSKMISLKGMLEEELNKKEMFIEQLSTDHLKIQCTDLEKKCADLELHLQDFKDKTSYLDGELSIYHARAEEQGIEITALRQQLESFQGKETETKSHLTDNFKDIMISQSEDAVEMSKTLSELHEQIQSCLANLKKQHFNLYMPANTECYYSYSNSQILNGTDSCCQKEQVVTILNSFIQLKDLFEANITTCNGEVKQNGEIRAMAAYVNEVQNKLEDSDLIANTSSTSSSGEKSLQMKSKPEIAGSSKEILENKFEIDKHKSDNLLKEQEVEALRCCQRQLETQISILQNEKRRLEENMEVVQKRGMMSSSCLDDSNNEIMMFNSSRMMSTGLDASQNQILVLNSSKDSHVSTSEIPTRMSELESSKSEMEIHLAELEKENIELSERICGLEAQLRYLTDERESSRLELQNSESCALNLQNEMRRLESEWETDKGDRKQKLQEMQNMWLEAQSENEYLKIANLKLQTTAESLIDECSLLQKSLLELRKQKIELHEHCTILEAELRESQKGFSDMLKEVEALERKYILILEEIASKEKALALEVDVLLQDNKQYKEKLEEETSLNQIYLEKAVEVENLQKEVAHITEHMSTTCDEKERTAAAAVVEVSRLRADRATLEASLHTVRGKLRLSESNLSTLQMESETKLLGLQNELAASRQNQEILMADNEKLLELLEDVKSNEDKYKSIVRGLELKLKATAYEGLQLKEEICSLRVQLQKTALLEDEILALKKSLNEVQFENQRLEVSLQMLSGDYEELMAAKMQLLQMISDMQKAVAELEHCRRSKVSLEEKILRLEGDLTAREALGGQDAELKNELARVKRANNELHRKIRHLQEENQEYIQRTQTCEGELEQRIEAKQISENSSGASRHLYPESNAISNSTSDELKLSQGDVKCNCAPGSSQVIGIEYLSKLQLLETKLAEALEANDMYKVQLKSFLLEECSNHSNKAGKEFEGSASTLEIELRDLQERYFHMSLKCAEVESEREQLVLKLRTVSNGRS
ncbi:CAP-Gly domain-containing linker protein 1 isoform X2 [Ricinus communis]|uniref:CAP-Gly domain-containing linker protein 1 isoform X2 n=1 Tax=Ricinus communis TaxID=3988 RepID=UPI00077280BC|nr:CAP-Gly domain-containing linker protein 1 isoform X2 [Ricinus communis]|eukprot:XP_015583817.1 CAP-Gly domain-containing linker protein 1 isoform X1 [Ricinus communis]